MGINKAILVGNVGKDPEVQYVREDVPVARFTLATNETYKDKDGQKVTKTEWHNIVVWRGLAKVVEQYVKKGMQLYLEGKISNRSYDQDGVTKYISEVVVNNLEMLSRVDGSSAQNKDTQSAQNTTPPPPDTVSDLSGEQTDDLPF